MRVLILIVLALLGTAFGPAAVAAEYRIDTRGAHASVTFRFKHIGISWLTGMFKDFNGTFTWDEENPAASSVVVEIDPASLDSNHAERDKHIRSDDYMDVERYPVARFESTRVEPAGDGKATIYGDLTLHGVTNEIAIDAELTGQGKDPWGGYRAGFAGTTAIDVRDFGMSMPPEHRVYLELYVEGVRQ